MKMTDKEFQALLDKLDDLPETMSDVSLKISSGVRAACGKDSVKFKLSAGQRRANARPEVRAKRSESASRTLSTPAVKEKLSKAQRLVNSKPEVRERKSRGMKSVNARPCTVDNVFFYPSLRALIDALGTGKQGSRSPNLRYVSKEEYSAWATKLEKK